MDETAAQDGLGLDLLQITLVVRDLEATEKAFAGALSLKVAFRDPSVDLWGLENIVLPMGTTFIEILSPKRPDTPGGRHLDRQGGDGGYMVILQTRDLAPWRERIERLGLRIAFESETHDAEDGQDWAGIHLHPSDTGGMMISLDRPSPPDSWAGAGPSWRDFICQDVVDGLCAIELRSPDPERLASRWSEVLGRSRDADGRIQLDHGAIAFRATTGNEVEGLSAVELHASRRERAGEQLALGGVEFRLV
jgi:catechol 2,3-dioxygenase-like lactoylglutathione lyase family enzyme